MSGGGGSMTGPSPTMYCASPPKSAEPEPIVAEPAAEPAVAEPVELDPVATAPVLGFGTGPFEPGESCCLPLPTAGSSMVTGGSMRSPGCRGAADPASSSVACE